ncbi:MAG: hypothetical protein L0216_01545 [Planctomycetales bacterium]|nr:hypothetical protein [Planctomycetales bacterium]
MPLEKKAAAERKAQAVGETRGKKKAGVSSGKVPEENDPKGERESVTRDDHAGALLAKLRLAAEIRRLHGLSVQVRERAEVLVRGGSGPERAVRAAVAGALGLSADPPGTADRGG